MRYPLRDGQWTKREETFERCADAPMWSLVLTVLRGTASWPVRFGALGRKVLLTVFFFFIFFFSLALLRMSAYGMIRVRQVPLGKYPAGEKVKIFLS
jgi:hypothetical protein